MSNWIYTFLEQFFSLLYDYLQTGNRNFVHLDSRIAEADRRLLNCVTGGGVLPTVPYTGRLRPKGVAQEWVAVAWESNGANNGDTRNEWESAHIPYLIPCAGWETVINNFVRSTGVIKKEVHTDNMFNSFFLVSRFARAIDLISYL